MHAFGLEIAGAEWLVGLHEGPGPDPDRRVEVTICRSEPAFASSGFAELSGVEGLSVREHATDGWRVQATASGTHVLTRDGRGLGTRPPPTATWRWPRLLFAQVLPLAAVLQGTEIFHASAVASHGRVIGLVGGSGQGKSTLAAALMRRGAAFVTDDALALEVHDDAIQAHPGPLFAATNGGPAPYGQPAGARTGAALPLHALYILDRGSHHSRLSAWPVASPLPTVLAAAFVPYVRDMDRQRRLFDLAAAISGTGVVRHLAMPLRADPDETARMVLQETGFDGGDPGARYRQPHG